MTTPVSTGSGRRGPAAAPPGRAGRPRVVADPQAEAGPAGRAERPARPAAQPPRRAHGRLASCPASPTRSPTTPRSAQPLLDEAAAAGVAFAAEILERRGRRPPAAPRPSATSPTRPPPPSSSRCAAGSSTPSSTSAGDEQQVLVEAVGSAYREWKSERIERIAGDVLAAAFSRGTWHQVPDGESAALDRRGHRRPLPRLRRRRPGREPAQGRALSDGPALPAGPPRLPLPAGAGRRVRPPRAAGDFPRPCHPQPDTFLIRLAHRNAYARRSASPAPPRVAPDPDRRGGRRWSR